MILTYKQKYLSKLLKEQTELSFYGHIGMDVSDNMAIRERVEVYDILSDLVKSSKGIPNTLI